jgi:hypothetical protein
LAAQLASRGSPLGSGRRGWPYFMSACCAASCAPKSRGARSYVCIKLRASDLMSSSLSLLAMSASLHMECNSRIPISVRSIVSRVGDNPAGLLSECRRVQQHQFLALWSGSHVQAIFTFIRPPGRARVGRGAAVMEQGQRRQGRQHQRHHTTPQRWTVCGTVPAAPANPHLPAPPQPTRGRGPIRRVAWTSVAQRVLSRQQQHHLNRHGTAAEPIQFQCAILRCAGRCRRERGANKRPRTTLAVTAARSTEPSHFAAAGGGDNRRTGRPTSHSASSSEHRVNSPDRNTDGLPAESARRCAGIGTHGQSCRSTNGGAGPPINAIRTPERDDWRCVH